MEEENIFESDYLYIKKKTEILETCECPKNTNTINSRDARTNTICICGICFWKGITVADDQLLNNVCSRCKADDKEFKSCVYKLVESTNKTLPFEPVCFKACINSRYARTNAFGGTGFITRDSFWQTIYLFLFITNELKRAQKIDFISFLTVTR